MIYLNILKIIFAPKAENQECGQGEMCVFRSLYLVGKSTITATFAAIT